MAQSYAKSMDMISYMIVKVQSWGRGAKVSLRNGVLNETGPSQTVGTQGLAMAIIKMIPTYLPRQAGTYAVAYA